MARKKITKLRDEQIPKINRSYDIFSLEKRIYDLEKNGGGGNTSLTFEIVSETNVTLKDNTDHTITVTKTYTNPFVFATNALPKTQWGGVLVATNPVYNNGSITFHYNSNDNTLANGQKYDVDWLIIDLPTT